MKKIIIVGGVAGGMSAATRLRRLMEDAEIIVLEKGPHVSFANCGLPYYLSGEISEREDLLVQTPASLKARFKLDVRPENEALAIDAVKKELTIRGPQGEYQERYDHLILSPGAQPLMPPIPGLSEAENLFTLRNVPDLDEIMAHLEKQHVKHATIIGAGFIGLEVAENLVRKGIQVTIVEQAPHVLPPLDQEMAAFVEKELIKHEVTVLTSAAASGFTNQGKTVELSNGENLTTDLIILSVGVKPATELAADAGIDLGMRGGILVDDRYETNLKDIYAVGDAIIVKNQVTQADSLIALASPANRQGRQVADVIAGLPRKNKGSLGTAIVRVFDLTAASTGISERQAQLAELPYQVVHVKGKDHAGYYPGATELLLKIIFHPKTGAIYGAQGIGEKGIDKRIDILATAIKAEMTVFDLPELEFTYAPPFGSAKDPVNMLGYAASNLLEGTSTSIQWHELDEAINTGSVLIDVRSSDELKNNGKFKHGLNIPLTELRDRLTELDPSQNYIVSCESSGRSYIAERILKQAGFKAHNLDGSFYLYKTVKPENISWP